MVGKRPPVGALFPSSPGPWPLPASYKLLLSEDSVTLVVGVEAGITGEDS